MSSTVNAGSLTLSVLVTVPNPTSSFATPAASVQVQNASPFVVSVTAGGEVYTLQSFTAQTIPTASDGNSITILPTSGPAGTQGNVECIWLQPGESPPMADGQLTGAAQYAQGLGQILISGSGSVLNFTAPPVEYTFQIPSVPPNIRTLLFNLKVSSFAGSGITGVTFGQLSVVGNQSGFEYFNQAPYLQAGGTSPAAIVVVPIVALFDTSFTCTVVYTVTSSGGSSSIIGTYSVAGDTAEYDESIFYNGPTQAAGTAAAAPSTVTLLNGPARVLSVVLEAISPGSEGILILNGTQQMARVDSTAGSTVPFSLAVPLPRDFIIPTGRSMAISSNGSAGSFVGGSVSYAYP